ncbi:MAG TPA: CRISPR system precrRNA processing endoribonuclease RAMP protein Cas6, partial [Desulfatiglandales bacterium]|nr:CRISPR system precrRNA processing endoribonuclease RAMP protein Cas6 [Desulfatiglandales bacterium]
MLKDFYLTDLEFRLRFETELEIDAYQAGGLLCRAFGAGLRRMVCINLREKCIECLAAESCAYQRIFSPITPINSKRLVKNRDMPRGYIIKLPLDAGTYGPEKPFDFRMIVVGRLIQWLPYIIIPFSGLGRTGIGEKRIPFTFERLLARNADGTYGQEIYSSEDNFVRPSRIASIAYNELKSLEKDRRASLSLAFLTPTFLMFNPEGKKGGSRPMRVPEFHVVIKRIRDRINRLATAFCATEFNTDYKELGAKAERIKISSIDGGWRERTRRKSNGASQDISGFIGSITYEGNFEEFMPLLKLGEFLHVGKNTIFGSGWY